MLVFGARRAFVSPQNIPNDLFPIWSFHVSSPVHSSAHSIVPSCRNDHRSTAAQLRVVDDDDDEGSVDADRPTDAQTPADCGGGRPPRRAT